MGDRSPFPVIPIHKHEKRPTRKGILVDTTCDSDGKIDKFVDLHDIRHTLDLHALKEGEEYFIGIFLVGAYQDAMGDLHNLFGKVNEVHVLSDPKEGYYIEKIIPGDTAAMVLDRVQYKEAELMSDITKMLDDRIEQQSISYKEREEVLGHFQRALQAYTYIEPTA